MNRQRKIFSGLTGIMAILMMTGVFSGCNVINPAEDIPSYIEVDSIGIYTDNETQGTASSNISDVWLTIDGTFLCGYPLGTKIPVLFTGPHRVILSAGILLNGIEGTRVPYEVFQTFDTIIDFKPGMIHSVLPRITYLSTAHFPMIEDFDHTSFKFKTETESAELLVEHNSFEHDGGIAIMDAARPTFEAMTLDSFDLPGGTIATYVEINYKCNTDFLVSVKANSTLGPFTFPLLVIRSTDTWKKLYVNLTPIILQSEHATDWKIDLSATLASGHTSDTLRFDNIKLVY